MSKKYNDKQIAKMIAKTILKTIEKASAKNPVQDVLDPDFIAEADPKSVPVTRAGVMYKSKPEKLKNFLSKRKKKMEKKEEV